MKLVEQATGEKLGGTLRNNLLLVADEVSGLNGAQVYDSVLEEFRIGEATPATSIEPIPEPLAEPSQAPESAESAESAQQQP